MAKGVAHAGKSIGMSSGNADENVRQKNDKENKGQKMTWDESTYRAKNRLPFNNYDYSRRDLNFEITRGTDGKPKIIPLGSQDVTLYKRYQNILQDIGFQQYKMGASNQQLTYVEIILSGSTEKMQKLAFGNQEVNYERNPERWHNWGVTRTRNIEEWAMDSYDFLCNKYGQENVFGFEVHLDETEPHIHANIVPTAIMQQRGQVGGYIKIDKDGHDVRYTKGKHIGELVKLNKAKYERLSEEKKKEYRPNVRGTVRTISYATHFGSTKRERSEKMSQLHTDFYEKVGKKWGFERGDVWADLSEEERRARRRRTKEEAYLEKEAKAAKEKAEQEAKNAEEKAIIAERRSAKASGVIQTQENTWRENQAKIKRQEETISINETVMEENNEAIKTQERNIASINETIRDKNDELGEVIKEINHAIEDKNKALSDKDIIDWEIDNSKNILENNNKTIESQETQIKSNSATIAAQEKNKAELRESIDLMSKIKNLNSKYVSTYVKEFKDVKFAVDRDIRNKLVSPLKNHPRIKCPNPPLTAEELERIAIDEEEKVINNIGVFGKSNKQAFNEIRAIRSDVQTIYINVVSAEQSKGIIEANKDLYSETRKELAWMFIKAEKYDKLEKAGVSLTNYEAVKHKMEAAENASRKITGAEDMLEYAWPGVTKAKNVLIDPSLDKKYMSEEQQKYVLNALRNDPKYRLKDIMKLLKYANSFREIPTATRAEAIKLATANIVKSIALSGYDLVKEAKSQVADFANDLSLNLADAADRAASAAVCLILGYLDAATTVTSVGGGGGGGNNELPRKKDDEDMKSWYGRCLNAAVTMMRPKQYKLRR